MKLTEVSDFKKREIEHELRHEKPNNYAVCINDKPWKVVSSRSRAEKMANTLKAKGKDAAVHMTGAPVSESIREGDVIPGNFDYKSPQSRQISKSIVHAELASINEKIVNLEDALQQAENKKLLPIDLLELKEECGRGINFVNAYIDELGESTNESGARMKGKRFVVYIDGVPKIHFATKKEAEEATSILNVSGASNKPEIRFEEVPESVGEASIPQKPKSYDKRNPVAKNIEKFNRPATHTDKKKDMKKGEVKHKGSLYDDLMQIEAKKKKTRLDPKCWKGYKKQGTKVKGGVRVNNCVPK